MNTLFLTGTLGREPELKKTANGTIYMRNSIGVWRPSKEKTKDNVDFIPLQLKPRIQTHKSKKPKKNLSTRPTEATPAKSKSARPVAQPAACGTTTTKSAA